MRLNELFSDGAIFAANKPIRVFGTGGGVASVDFCGKTYTCETRLAEWEITLDAMDYGGPYEMTVDLNGRRKIIRDVYIGDVYLLAGQSNIQYKLKETNHPEEYEGEENLRLFSCDRLEQGEKFLPEDGWVTATMENVGDFSAIGYIFGKNLARKTGHKVGLVTCYQGAADIQCFLPRSVFEEYPQLVIPEEDRYDMQFVWNKYPSILFDFALKCVSPFVFDGIVWYQGESNCSPKESAVYGEMLRLLIETWRAELRDKELPFIVVQIHDYDKRDTPYWHAIQKAQWDIQNVLPRVKTVVSKDVSEKDLIHPNNKKDVSLRITSAALDFLKESGK